MIIPFVQKVTELEQNNYFLSSIPAPHKASIDMRMPWVAIYARNVWSAASSSSMEGFYSLHIYDRIPDQMSLDARNLNERRISVEEMDVLVKARAAQLSKFCTSNWILWTGIKVSIYAIVYKGFYLNDKRRRLQHEVVPFTKFRTVSPSLFWQLSQLNY